MEATLNLFQGHIDSIQDIGGSGQVVAAHLTGEVQGLATLGLNQSELIANTGHGGIDEDGAAGLDRSAGDIEVEGNGLGQLTGGDGGGQGEVHIFLVGVLVDTDNHNTVSGSVDGHILGGSVGGPCHIKSIGADANDGNQLQVTDDLAGLVLVHGLQVSACVLQSLGGVIHSGLGGVGAGGGIGGIGGGAACEHGDAHGQQQCPGDQFLHG